MILTVNVSNSNLTLGAWENNAHVFGTSVHTNVSKSADEYASQLHSMLQLYQRSAKDIEGVIVSCVVPAMLATVRKALSHLYEGRIYVVGPGLKTGLSIQTDNPAQMGSDLVCSAVAALAQDKMPCLLIALDTATSLTLLDANGALQGSAIAPGVKISAEALCTRTAQLPQIDLTAKVSTVLGTNSIDSVQAGVVLGHACMLDGMIDRFAALVKGELTCLATGELAPTILPHCTHPIAWRENLVHEGLFLLHKRNAK